jgi:predicted nucleic acid-binding protein
VALTVLDASVLIALLDPNDALHPGATAALTAHAGDDLQIPASAYSESLVGPARSGRVAEARVTATELRARHPEFRLPDALVVATGAALGADAIMTADAGWRRLGRSVRVVRAG